METEEFRKSGKEMVDYICQYMNTLSTRRVTPSVEPGYLRKEIPLEAPFDPEPWTDIMKDVDSKIMPGVTHWQHPRFFAYFPSGNSYPSLLGDMLADGLGCIGFSWAASPACTELETIVLDWVGKAVGLPDYFLTLPKDSKGGGVIEGSASECLFVSMMAARANAIKRLKTFHPSEDEGVLLSKLIAYCSKDAHSCVEKAAMMTFVKLRILPMDEHGSLRGETLKQAMQEDVELGRVPFFVSTTLGTTSRCAFDNITEIGPIAKQYPCVWLHVDGAYGGSSFLCPELKPLMAGVEYADSFNLNTNKWMLVNFDCSLLWVRDRLLLTSALVVDPLYLQHGYDKTAIDYRHWGIPLSRRFRSLKLWFVIRSYGISGLQAYIRNHIKLAKYFEGLVRRDERFEVCNDVKLALVCFRLVGSVGDAAEEENINKRLLSNLNASGKIHMVPAYVNDKYAIRFCVVAQNCTKEDIGINIKLVVVNGKVFFDDPLHFFKLSFRCISIDAAWELITEYANEILESSDKDRELGDLAAKGRRNLAYKRSFFVRMVSDPNIYNPGIAKTTPLATQPPKLETPQDSVTSVDSDTSSVSSSWISWPLGFFFQSVDHDNGNDLPLRFRHFSTTVRLKSPCSTRRNSASPSPENNHE